jgi:predicted phosphodiesterase
MRYAIISDVHANASALKTALTDIADMKVDRIICLGDCVGYGLEPVETLELLYRKAHVVLMGNHDAAVCGKLSTRFFSERATKAVERHRVQISETGMRWLERLPLMAEGKNFRCTHGDFSRPELFRYVFDPEEAMPSWNATTEAVLFVGHTHHPLVHVIGPSGVPHAVDCCDFECEEGKRYIINPGSIGAPRTENARSTYCIYDDKARTVEFRSLPFDFEAYVQALQAANAEVDPSALKHEAAQYLPEVREGVAFSNHPSEMEAAKDVIHSMRLPSTKFLQRLATTLVLGLLLITTIAVFMMMQINHDVEPKMTSGFIPAQELPVIQVPPPTSSDKNMLPVLPQSLSEKGVVPGWRYCVEDGPLQHVETGIRNGEITLCFSHDQFLRLEVATPLIALGSTSNQALRVRGRIRRSDNFNGSVMFNVSMLAKKEDGTFEPLMTSPFEVRNTRGEPVGALSLNRKVPINKRTTHIRFSIVTTFKGILDIEQPVLTGEKDD